MPQSLAQVWLHVIFSTKERRPFFQNSEFREEMFRTLAHHVNEAKCVPQREASTRPDSIAYADVRCSVRDTRAILVK
jgi:hypothetical protein